MREGRRNATAHKHTGAQRQAFAHASIVQHVERHTPWAYCATLTTRAPKGLCNLPVDKHCGVWYNGHNKDKEGTDMMHYYKDTNTRGMAWLATALLVLLIAAVGLLIVAPMMHADKEAAQYGYYALTAQVVELDRQHDTVLVEDGAGNLWAFEGCEDWMEGDVVSLLMHDCGTPNITDDAIISVRYSAWTLTR